jgi:hypothetical protein
MARLRLGRTGRVGAASIVHCARWEGEEVGRHLNSQARTDCSRARRFAGWTRGLENERNQRRRRILPGRGPPVIVSCRVWRGAGTLLWLSEPTFSFLFFFQFSNVFPMLSKYTRVYNYIPFKRMIPQIICTKINIYFAENIIFYEKSII